MVQMGFLNEVDFVVKPRKVPLNAYLCVFMYGITWRARVLARWGGPLMGFKWGLFGGE